MARYPLGAARMLLLSVLSLGLTGARPVSHLPEGRFVITLPNPHRSLPLLKKTFAWLEAAVPETLAPVSAIESRLGLHVFREKDWMKAGLDTGAPFHWWGHLGGSSTLEMRAKAVQTTDAFLKRIKPHPKPKQTKSRPGCTPKTPGGCQPIPIHGTRSGQRFFLTSDAPATSPSLRTAKNFLAPTQKPAVGKLQEPDLWLHTGSLDPIEGVTAVAQLKPDRITVHLAVHFNFAASLIVGEFRSPHPARPLISGLGSIRPAIDLRIRFTSPATALIAETFGLTGPDANFFTGALHGILTTGGSILLAGAAAHHTPPEKIRRFQKLLKRIHPTSESKIVKTKQELVVLIRFLGKDRTPIKRWWTKSPVAPNRFNPKASPIEAHISGPGLLRALKARRTIRQGPRMEAEAHRLFQKQWGNLFQKAQALSLKGQIYGQWTNLELTVHRKKQ